MSNPIPDEMVERCAKALWETQAAPLRERRWENETDAERLDFRYAATTVLHAAMGCPRGYGFACPECGITPQEKGRAMPNPEHLRRCGICGFAHIDHIRGAVPEGCCAQFEHSCEWFKNGSCVECGGPYTAEYVPPSERWAVEKRNLVRVPADWAPEDHTWIEVRVVGIRTQRSDA